MPPQKRFLQSQNLKRLIQPDGVESYFLIDVYKPHFVQEFLDQPLYNSSICIGIPAQFY